MAEIHGKLCKSNNFYRKEAAEDSGKDWRMVSFTVFVNCIYWDKKDSTPLDLPSGADVTITGDFTPNKIKPGTFQFKVSKVEIVNAGEEKKKEEEPKLSDLDDNFL